VTDNRVYRVADLFAGAGGSSSGAARAIAAMGGEIDLVAVNHWNVAIATHTANHPKARHYCVNLDAARPEDLVPEGYLDLMMASPECVHFSRARGGKPVSDQTRMSAWHVQRWASNLDVRCILVENVAEFVTWGPLVEGHPDPKRKGAYFQAWIQSLWAMGYTVDWKLINAADFGDATTRTRFFLQARKDGLPIRWPTASHSATGSADLLGHQRRWRAARDVIDWAVPGRSILTRKKPLSEKTRRRIARGLIRFGGKLAPLYVRLLDLEETPPADRDRRVVAVRVRQSRARTPQIDRRPAADDHDAAWLECRRRRAHTPAIRRRQPKQRGRERYRPSDPDRDDLDGRRNRARRADLRAVHARTSRAAVSRARLTPQSRRSAPGPRSRWWTRS